MAKGNNPFTPGFGQVPYILAGRSQIIEEISHAFDLDYRDPSLTSIFIGARGTGKTALLSLLGSRAKQRGWIAADSVAMSGMLDDIYQRCVEAASEFLEPQARHHLRSVSVANIGSVEWEANSGLELNWRGKMNLLLDQLSEHDVGLLITIDEVDPSLPEVAELLSVYQLFVREERKVALLLAGLPGRVVTLLSKRDVTFIRRAKRVTLGRIPDADVADAFEKTIEEGGRKISLDALHLAVEEIGGFAYLIQAVGYRSWNAGDDDVISIDDVRRGAAMALREYEDGVLESTYLDLSKGDKAFLRAMLEDEGESAVSDIIVRLGKSSNSVQKTRKRLIDLGVIGERGRGFLVFELPKFREFLEARL